ncbi:MAG: GAF domain-containing protein, partial [Desulfobacterales bacterium]|nr:GAF domain-containing protein [Desulfobacterales bacterium]
MPICKKAMESGLQSGDLIYVGYAAFTMLRWNPNLNLKETYKLGEENMQITMASKLQDNIDGGNASQGYRLNLMGLTKGRFSLDHSVFNENDCLTALQQRKSLLLTTNILALKLQIYYLYEAFEEASKIIPEIDKSIQPAAGSLLNMECSFYAFMTFAALYPKMVDKKEQRQALKRMKKEYKQMKKWHDYYPVNFYHLVYMMESEFARIKGNSQTAISCLEKAIDTATENEFLQYKALANKLLGKLYLSLNKNRVAGLYLADAYYDYQVWGATEVLTFLKEQYASCLDLGVLQRQAGSYQTQTISDTSGTSADSARKGAIDLGTVTKAAQAISGEVMLGKLLTKLMQTVRENAGAEKALLLLAQGPDNELFIQAQSLAESPIEIMLAEKPEDSDHLSLGIVNYVTRSLESVVLGDAAKEGDFTSDPYIQTRQPTSVLGMPVLNQGKLVGLLYLENNVAAHAFTPERLEVLQILASQAAISIENAGFFKKM